MQRTKLKAYSAVSAAFLCAGLQAESQVIYHDIDPDSIADSHGETVPIDLNGDGLTDITLTKLLLQTYSSQLFTLGSASFPGTAYYNDIYAFPAPNAAIAGSVGPFSDSYPDKLVLNDSISHSKVWLTGNSQSLVYSLLYNLETQPGIFVESQIIADGQWFGGATDKFLGIRINEVDGPHYGWIRLDVASDNRSFTVKDFAYNTQPDEGILAGTSTVFTDSIPLAIPDLSASFDAWTAGNILYIRQASNENAQLELFDMQGRLIREKLIAGEQNEITLPAINAGLYIIRLTGKMNREQKKVFIGK